MLVSSLLCLVSLALAQDPSSLPATPPSEWAVYGIGGVQFLLTLLLGGRHLQSGGAIDQAQKDLRGLEARIAETREHYLTRQDFGRVVAELEARSTERVNKTAERTEEHGRQLQETRSLSERLQVRFEEMDKRLDNVSDRLGRVETQVATVLHEMEKVGRQNSEIIGLLKGGGR